MMRPRCEWPAAWVYRVVLLSRNAKRRDNDGSSRRPELRDFVTGAGGILLSGAEDAIIPAGCYLNTHLVIQRKRERKAVTGQ